MVRIPVVVVGAGHAGLAVSHHLSARSLDHVVLERGEVANTWRTERWDSLRLLTPNWQNRLPGLAYSGDDPEGFMTVSELVGFIDTYARQIDAPVQTRTEVTSVRPAETGYEVATREGTYETQAVVLASGGFNLPKLPTVAGDMSPEIDTVSIPGYRNPGQLKSGGVLVVGASATGIQIADEVHRSGRPVTIAVGEHVRMPRTYRGKDIFWWLEGIGRLDERYDEVDDIVRARHVASPQLVGTPDRSTLDLNALSSIGVRLVGRFSAASDGRWHFSGSLPNVCKLADLKLGRLLDEIDQWATATGLDSVVVPGERQAPTVVDDDPVLSLDYAAEGIETVIWATGFRSDYSWLDVPVLDRKGEIRHDGGVVTGSPGLYRIGLNFLRRRKSSFIHGADDDAHDLTEHLATYLRHPGKILAPALARS